MRIGSVVIVLIIAFLGLGYLVSDNLHIQQALQQAKNTSPQEYSTEIARINDEIITMKQELDELSQEIGAPDVSPDVLVLRGEIQNMNERLSSIENVILLDPEKAITIIVLRTELESTQKDIDRLYSIVDVIGIAIFGSIITLALGSLDIIRKSKRVE
jgi:hypothetical protein